MHFRACHNAYVSMPFLYLPCLFFGGKIIYWRSRIFLNYGGVERSNESLTGA